MNRGVRPNWAHLAAGLVLLSLALAVYAPLVAPGRAPYSAYSDVVAEHLALKQVAFDGPARRSGLPLWRDDQFGGVGALTNPQALYLHPLHAAFLVLPPLAAIGWTFLLQFWAAAWGCYALARVVGASWLAGLFSGAGALVAFKLILAAHAGWLAPLATLALVPLWLAACLRLAEQSDLARTLQLAWVAALGLAGGSPQPLYYACLLSCPYCLWAALARGGRGRWRSGGRALLLTAAAIGLGLACNAYLWLPLVSEWPWLGRRSGRGDYTFFLSGHALGPRQLLTLLEPAGFAALPREAWEDNAYFGWLPLGLAALGAASAPAGSARRYLGWMLLASLLLSLDTPLLRAAYAALPGYASFRLPGRMLFLTTYLGLALAGTGLDRVLAWCETRYAWSASAIAALALLVVVLQGSQHVATYLTTAPAAALLPDADHPARALPLGPARSAVVGRGTLNYGWSAELRLRLVNGYDPYNYAHYKRLMALVGRPLAASGSPQPAADGGPGNWLDLPRLARPDLLDELAVRDVFAASALQAPQFALREQRAAVRNFVLYKGLRETPLYVYQNLYARPYARWASSVQRLASLDAVENQLAHQTLHGQAYVVEAGPEAGVAATLGRDPQLRLLGLRPGRLQLQVATDRTRLLVVAEAFHPGWRAWVDGQRRAVVQVNLALLGIWVEAGASAVRLEFVPLHWAWGLGLSASAGSLLCALSGWALARRRARTAEPRGRDA